MRKQEFIYQLWKKLSDLPKEEVEERLSFYAEMIDDRMEEGLSEEEAVAAIGSTDEIAGQIVDDAAAGKRIDQVGRAHLNSAGTCQHQLTDVAR